MAGAAAGNERRHLQVLHGATLAMRVGEDLQNPVREYLSSVLPSSFGLYLGPTAPPGKEKNWLRTVPGKGYFVILRLYGPTEPFLNQTWRPGDIEEIK